MMLPEVLAILVPLLLPCHTIRHEISNSLAQFGPFLPRIDHKIPLMVGKNTPRPPKPIMQMAVLRQQINPCYVSILVVVIVVVIQIILTWLVYRISGELCEILTIGFF